jgi:signal recognition particle receptor subunit beta
MGSSGSPPEGDLLTISAKIVVAGGFGVGKTTFVGAVSEVPPMSNEAWMTEAGEGIDEIPPGGKSTTTVAMDFGRITLRPDLSRGALGAVVLVDTSRIDESFAAINYFENDSELPFVVAVNQFEGKPVHDLDEVRDALALDPSVPLVTCDARDRASTIATLTELVGHTLSLAVLSGPVGRELAGSAPHA